MKKEVEVSLCFSGRQEMQAKACIAGKGGKGGVQAV